MHTKAEYLDWRERFRPDPIKLIIVAESPPFSQEYFYKPKHGSGRDEVLFRTLMKHIEADYQTKEQGLTKFQGKGWYLIDATYTPVNNIKDDKERNKAIMRNYPELVTDLRSLTPDCSTPIILIKSNVCKLLESRLLKEGFRVINRGIRPPFPLYGDTVFRSKLSEILRAS